MDHRLNTSLIAATSAATAAVPLQRQAAAAPALSFRTLDAGKAITLRARHLSVLRIAHGQVWATISDAGTYSRVLAGDHFLSQGQSLILLPGQALVMESFAPLSGGSGQPAAQFSWDAPGTATSVLQVATAAHPAIGSGVLQPLRDLRHALHLAAGACRRLAQALALGAVTTPAVIFNTFAIFMIARGACKSCADSTLDMQKSRSW